MGIDKGGSGEPGAPGAPREPGTGVEHGTAEKENVSTLRIELGDLSKRLDPLKAKLVEKGFTDEQIEHINRTIYTGETPKGLSELAEEYADLSLEVLNLQTKIDLLERKS